ncbi:MAG: hypothetical protein HZA81_03760 [Candidatus Taylorbacteria bacterium]|nr:hypothetical protein [Candidatus Taylorbacteria bacterium]
MQSTFTIKEALSYGWTKFRENVKFLVLLTLGFFVAAGIIGFTGDKSLAAQLLGMAVNLFAMLTFVRVGLKIHAGGKPEAKDIFAASWGMFGRYVLATLLFTVSYIAGFAALILPGVYLVVRLGVFAFALVEEDMKPLESIKRSWSLTKGRFWDLLGFSVVLFLLNLLGALALGVGLLITSPVCLLATVYVYQSLKALPVKAPDPHPAV